MATSKSPYLKLEKLIASDDRGGIEHRWQYGQKLLKDRAGRQRLPKGMLADLVAAAARTGLKLSEQELQRRMRLAEAYPTEAHSRHAVMLMGSWHNLVQAGFPSVDIDESDDEVDDIEEITVSVAPTDDFEQDPLFDIPGFKPVLKINGRKRDLVDASVRDAIAYRDMCRGMHANFGRTVAEIDTSVERMIAGADGNLDANAIEAYRRATSQPSA